MIRAILLLVVLCCAALPARAAELRLLAATALKDALEPLAREFTAATGRTVTLVFAGTVATRDRIRRGESADLVLIGADALDALIAEGLLSREERRDIARSGLGAAARAGLPRPDITSEAGLRRTLAAAGSIAFSRGPSGEHVERLLVRLGLDGEVASRVRRPGSGAEVAQLIAAGGAEFGIAQVSEFMGVPGLADLGPLPAEMQAWTIYAASPHVRTADRAGATALLAHLGERSAVAALRAIGMEAVR